MTRRLAVLDDNQRVLERRLEDLRAALPDLVANRVCAAAVIGSVAEGRARDGSDIDLVLVLRTGAPMRSDYRWWDDSIAAVLSEEPFPLQPVFVSRGSVRTEEPRLRRAIANAIPIWDSEDLFDDQSRPGA